MRDKHRGIGLPGAQHHVPLPDDGNRASAALHAPATATFASSPAVAGAAAAPAPAFSSWAFSSVTWACSELISLVLFVNIFPKAPGG